MKHSSPRSRSPNADCAQRAKKIVVIGGGTGTFTVLSGLRAYDGLDLTAITTMADDGGSTGRLRDEYGVLPPGDLRQCLVALAEAPRVLRELFSFRYDRGSFAGHSFGNILLSTLEQMTGSLDRALEVAGEVLAIRGAVIPVTLKKVRLLTELGDGTRLAGEQALTNCARISKAGIARMSLVPKAQANPKALAAIEAADLIVIGPGNFYSSLVPNLLVAGIAPALRKAKGKKVLVANLMNKRGQTDGFTAARYLSTLEQFALGRRLFDCVLCNRARAPQALLRRYREEGEPVACGARAANGRPVISRNLLARSLYRPKAGDTLRRTLIRHDPAKLAGALVALLP